MSNILKEQKVAITMPKAISIGDPMYFDDYQNDPKRLAELTYERNFRRPTWKAAFKFIESEESFQLGEKTHSYKMNSLLIACAPTEEQVDTYLNEEYYRGQKPKTIQIGVDTAEYSLAINDMSILVKTGGDGCVGSATEYDRGQKLEGIFIELSLSDLQSYEDWQQDIEYLFNIKF